MSPGELALWSVAVVVATIAGCVSVIAVLALIRTFKGKDSNA